MQTPTKLRLLATVFSLALATAATAAAPTITSAGALKTRTGAIEIGLAFDKDLDAATAGDASRYKISKGTIAEVRFQEYVHPFGAVAIATTGVEDGDTVTVTVTGVKDLDGNAMPATTRTLTVHPKLTRANVGGTKYVDVDGEEATVWPVDAVAVGDKDFDLVGSGNKNWTNYDELSFAYEFVTGDFDKVARVEHQDPSSQWGRAGLMVRAALDSGKTQAQVADEEYKFSRNLTFRVNPAVQASGEPGYNAHQISYRATDGGGYENIEDFASPEYPNAWLRVKREGQKFTCYRATDGVNWTAVGDYTFLGKDALPATVLFGPFYGPTLDDNGTKNVVGHSTHMRVRDYADFARPTSAPAVTGAGALKTGAGVIEIGLSFDRDLDAATASNADNYKVSKGTISSVRFQEFVHPHGAVALATTGIAEGDSVTVTVTGVKDLAGNTMPATSKTLTVRARLTRVQVGGSKYVDVEGGSPSDWPTDTVAVGERDYDLVSGGSKNWTNYDEVGFAYEAVTGDFDKVARVEYQDPSSEWGRAGLMVRAALDEAKTRAEADGGYKFSRNLTFRGNPTIRANGDPGYNAHQISYRATDGGPYSNIEDLTPPAYPNAWLRVKREGQKFTCYRGTDGVTWTAVGDYTFVDADVLPATVFFGPFYGPTLDDNATKGVVGHSTWMGVRDYGDFGAVAPPTELKITSATVVAGTITIQWTGGGTLQSTTGLVSPVTWKDESGSGNFSGPATGFGRFFRVRR